MCCFALKWSLVCDQNNREKKIKKSSSQKRPKKIPHQSRRLWFFPTEEFLFCVKTKRAKKAKFFRVSLSIGSESRRLYQNVCHHPHQKYFLDKKKKKKKKKKTAQKKTDDCFCKEDKEEGDQNNCRGRRSRTTFTNSKKVRYNSNKQQQHHQRV